MRTAMVDCMPERAMPTARQLRESAMEKGEYLISYPEGWRDEHPPVDAVIVSFEKREGVIRQRAVDDRQRMHQLFKMLGFHVKILVDKSADELKTDLKLTSSSLKSDSTNCFVCFVSAYGDRDCDGRLFIRDLEGNKVYVMEDIIEPFKRCKALVGKPKVFFINSRIWKSDKHTLNSVAGESSTTSLIKKGRHQDPCKDFLAVFSSEEEKLDEPDPCHRTAFVPALIQSLIQNHDDKDVGEIVNEANLYQTVSVQSTLDHKLFWRAPDQLSKRMPLVFKTPDQTPELDIVLFHGYEFVDSVQYPAVLSSWFTKSAIPVCWPKEWLPKELGGIPMRVFCLKYSESTDKPELELEPEPEPMTSKRTLNELAEQVRKDLGTLATKPLIFIAHGLGGLLIQYVLNSKEESVQNLKKWLRGIVFYGVPYDLHSGAKNFSLMALESALQREKGNLSVVGKSEIEEAMESAGAMQSARQHFCKKYKDITLSFEEGTETYGSKINLVAAQKYATEVNTIVEKCSSRNHFDICRPETLDDSIFTDLLRFIRKQLRDCDRTDIIVGQDSHRKKLKSWLLTRETKAASVAGITGGETFGVAGMGGIGKTTLAKSLLDDEDIKNYYDHRVYWIPVKRHPNIIDCQRRLLSEICKEMPSKELDTENLLQEELKRKLSKLRRVLLFLDDVWEKNHVDRLLGDSFVKMFPQESKCIITSRKPAELAKLDTDEQIEKLDVLNDEDARTLFCSKAFLNGKMPTDNNLRVAVDEVIAACGNMPILLATIGADRWGKRSIDSWQKVRDRLKHVTAENAGDEESTKYQNLIKQVMISYDDLPESDPVSGEGIDFKDYFLDFAAFPEREEIEIAVLMDMWTKPGITEDGAYRILEELEQRCLVKIVGYWCHVHDIFRALAVKLVEEQRSLKKRKRLFAWELSNSRLPEEWGISQYARSGDSEDQFETEKMVIAKSEIETFHPSDAIIFRYLTRLRMLFLTSNLNLVSLPQEIGYMKCLEKLDLSWCLGLKRLPREIGQLKSLEKLNMAGCSSLTEIPAEVGKLKKLVELNMQSCGIEELPVEIGELTSLTYLCLNDCHQLRALPDVMGKLSSLERLECDMLQIIEIPKALGDLSKLKYLSFGACGGFTEIPAEFVNLKDLVYLWFVNSRSLKVVPDELDKLVTEGSLTVFNVYNTSVVWEELPPNLHALPRPFDGTINDDEVDSTADNPDGPYWSHRRGMLVNTTSLYDPSNKEQRRLSFGIVRVVTLAKNEPFMSPRFNMAIRIIYTMGNHTQTRHAIVRCGGVPVLLRCVDEGDPYLGAFAAATLANMCVTPSTHKAIVDSPHGLDILTRVLHRKNSVSDSAFQALLWIREGDRNEKEFTYYSEILEKCGHTSGHKGCACIWCQHLYRFHTRGASTFLEVKNIF